MIPTHNTPCNDNAPKWLIIIIIVQFSVMISTQDRSCKENIPKWILQVHGSVIIVLIVINNIHYTYVHEGIETYHRVVITDICT